MVLYSTSMEDLQAKHHPLSKERDGVPKFRYLMARALFPRKVTAVECSTPICSLGVFHGYRQSKLTGLRLPYSSNATTNGQLPSRAKLAVM